MADTRAYRAAPEPLTDGSVVWNVVGGGGDPQWARLTIGARSKRHAETLARNLNKASYVEAAEDYHS